MTMQEALQFVSQGPKRRGHACGIKLVCLAVFAVAQWSGPGQARAQGPDPTTLAVRSAVVVQGKVQKVQASAEPLLAATPSTVIIKVTRMLAGNEFAGDQTGHLVTVILSKPGSMKEGMEALFFGNPRFIGKTMTIADEGELPVQASNEAVAPAVAKGIQARRDAPIRERLAIAAMVFRGTVEAVKPLEQGEGKRREPPTEHDPEWQLATVKVTAAERGTQNGATVVVAFPASRDIMWFNSPKLKPGQDALFLAHRPQEDELRLLRTTGVLQQLEEAHGLVVSQPFDVLRPDEEKRVIELMQTKGVQ